MSSPTVSNAIIPPLAMAHFALCGIKVTVEYSASRLAYMVRVGRNGRYYDMLVDGFCSEEYWLQQVQLLDTMLRTGEGVT